MESERVHDNEMRPVTWEWVLNELTEALPELVADFMWQFQARELYANFDVPAHDLRETASESLALQVRRLRGEPDPPGVMDRIRRLAARRARQGVSLAAFLQANSLDFRVLWHRLESIAGEQGSAAIASNVTRVLDAVERYTNELRTAYLAEEARLDRGRSQQRHRAIQRLFSGDALTGSDIELIADRLETRPDATFEILAVIGEAISPLTARYGSDDRVVVYETARSMILLREQAESGSWPTEVSGRGGYVGGVTGLSQVPSAASSALVIARHAPRSEARFFTEEDVWTLVAHHHLEQALPRYTRSMHAALESESDHDRALIVEATMEYLQTGSVKITSERLFCHRNTVIKRLRYFARATGFDPTVPRDAAWIHVTLEGSGLAKRVQLHSSS